MSSKRKLISARISFSYSLKLGSHALPFLFFIGF
jgi:hypothetical protein